MNLITLLVSINKLSLIAFLIVLVFLGYEFFLLRKERQRGFKIKIPSFKVGKNYENKKKVIVKKDFSVRKANSLAISLGLIFLVVFGGMTFLGYVNFNRTSDFSKKGKKLSPSGKVHFVVGKGIKIYSLNWQPLVANQLTKGKNESIIIGVDKTGDENIKMARIRVNSDKWRKEDITTSYNSKNNVFYIKYKIKATDKQLKIVAQLFSQVDGWLGE